VDHQILDFDRGVTMQASVGATDEKIGISSEVSYVIPIWRPEILSITSTWRLIVLKVARRARQRSNGLVFKGDKQELSPCTSTDALLSGHAVPCSCCSWVYRHLFGLCSLGVPVWSQRCEA